MILGHFIRDCLITKDGKTNTDYLVLTPYNLYVFVKLIDLLNPKFQKKQDMFLEDLKNLQNSIIDAIVTGKSVNLEAFSRIKQYLVTFDRYGEFTFTPTRINYKKPIVSIDLKNIVLDMTPFVNLKNIIDDIKTCTNPITFLNNYNPFYTMEYLLSNNIFKPCNAGEQTNKISLPNNDNKRKIAREQAEYDLKFNIEEVVRTASPKPFVYKPLRQLANENSMKDLPKPVQPRLPTTPTTLNLSVLNLSRKASQGKSKSKTAKSKSGSKAKKQKVDFITTVSKIRLDSINIKDSLKGANRGKQTGIVKEFFRGFITKHFYDKSTNQYNISPYQIYKDSLLILLQF